MVSIEPIELRCSIRNDDFACDNSQLSQDIVAAHMENNRKVSGGVRSVPTGNRSHVRSE